MHEGRTDWLNVPARGGRPDDANGPTSDPVKQEIAAAARIRLDAFQGYFGLRNISVKLWLEREVDASEGRKRPLRTQ